MKIARVAMLGVALAAGGAAAYLASGSTSCRRLRRCRPKRCSSRQKSSISERRSATATSPSRSGPNTGKGIFIRKSENPNALADVKGSLAPARHFLGGRTVPPRPSRQGTDGGADVYHAVNRHESGRDRHRFPGRHQAVVSSCRTITSTSCALIATTKPPRRPAAMS